MTKTIYYMVSFIIEMPEKGNLKKEEKVHLHCMCLGVGLEEW